MLRPNLSCTILFATTVAFGALPAHAKDKRAGPQQLPQVFEAVVNCRTLTTDSERLACYDRSVGELAAAREKQDIVVADRATIRETKRGLFGFTLPRLKLFGGTEGEDVNEIESTLSAVRITQDGLAVFTLGDGARWRQTDGANTFAKAGQTIKIKRGSLGSFLATIGKGSAFRVLRMSQ